MLVILRLINTETRRKESQILSYIITDKNNYIYLQSTMQCFNTCVHCGVINTASIVIESNICHFFVVRMFIECLLWSKDAMVLG